MPIDPYAALNAMVRAEVARSSEPQQSDASGETGDVNHISDTSSSGEEDPKAAHRP